MQCCELHQRHTPINPAVIHAEINNNPAHSSTQPDQIWAQIIRGEVIFMRGDSGVCQKRAHFDIILGARWPTSLQTGDRKGQITRRDFMTKPRIQLFYSWPWSCCCCWAEIIPPEVSISAPHLRFCLWPSMIIRSPGKSPEDFLFLVQQRVRCTHQKSSSLLLSQQQVCWGFPTNQSALILQLSSHDDNLLTHDVVQWCLCLFSISFFFSTITHTFL